MKKKTTVVLALPLEDDQLQPLHDWAKKNDWSNIGEIHFIHVVKQVLSSLDYAYLEVPDEEHFEEMKPELMTFLQEEARAMLPPDLEGQVSFHLEKSFDPEEAITSLIEKVDADILIVGSRGRSGFEALLDHSVSQSMVKHAPCSVLVVRPENPSLST